MCVFLRKKRKGGKEKTEDPPAQARREKEREGKTKKYKHRPEKKGKERGGESEETSVFFKNPGIPSTIKVT